MALLYAICAMALVAAVALFMGRIEVYAVAQGRVQAVGKSKVIQPLEPGAVVAIHVANGDA